MTTSNISNLQPRAVWQWFSKICAIPHPTFHEQAIGSFIVEQAKLKGLEVEQDSKGNIRIQKPAAKGFEDAPAVALQAHMDMVPQKTTDSTHDFLKDPIQMRVENGLVYAQHTTLGADNGIGLAMALAVAFDDTIKHPPLVLILTVEEEVGMGGVQALSEDWLQVPILINLDTEEAGSLFIGCAGGRDVTLQLPLHKAEVSGLAYRIAITGLRGGHSGVDINQGRANANTSLARVLDYVYQRAQFSLLDIQGGTLRNAIPCEAHADVVFAQDELGLDKLIYDISTILKNEYRAIEVNLSVTLSKLDKQQSANIYAGSAVSLSSTEQAIALLRNIPYGVQSMSHEFAGVVQTSNNVGVVKLESDALHVACLMRSFAQTPKDELQDRIQCLAFLAGATMQASSDYPGWQPDPDSMLLAKSKEIFKRHYSVEPGIEVIHAGLECGILKGKMPNTDMISFGPTIRGAHSPNESVEIVTVEQCWDILLDLLTVIGRD